jgi:hypothetical protein
MVNRTDLEATIRAVLIRFHASAASDSSSIARFAQAGAEAILTQTQVEIWLDSATSASILGITIDELLRRVQCDQLPAIRGTDDQPRFHRRDVSLYRLNQQLGGTEQQVWPLTPPDMSDQDVAAWGFDPWTELTAG